MLGLRAHHPEQSEQVFARYNKGDSLSVALNLGYFEPATRFVASVACTVDVPGFGLVQVQGIGLDQRRLPAPRVEPTESGMKLTGVELGPQAYPKVVVFLSMTVRALRPQASESDARRVASAIYWSVVDANVDYFQRLATLPDHPGSQPGLRPLLRQVAAHQLDVLRSVDTPAC
jgi:hypothetical protein